MYAQECLEFGMEETTGLLLNTKTQTQSVHKRVIL